MFFHKLSQVQKVRLLALAKRMMIADAKVRVEEDAMYGVLRTELGLGTDPPTQDVFGEIDVSPFDDTYSRLLVLLTLATMAHIDNNLHQSESDVLREVAARFGVDDATYARIMGLAERQGDLVRDFEDFFEQNI